MSWASWVPAALSVAGSLLGDDEKSASGGTTSGSREPWRKQQPYLEELFKDSQTAYKANELSPFVGFDPLQTEAQNMQLAYARGMLPSTLGSLQSSWMSMLNPNTTTNPYLSSLIYNATRPLEQRLTEGVLPAIRTGAVTAGQYGGSRQGIAEGIATRGFTDASADIAAKLGANAWDTSQKLQLGGLQLAPSVLNMMTAPQSMISGVGEARRALALAEASRKASNLQAYKSLIGGDYGSVTSGSSTQPYKEPNLAKKLLGAGSAAAGATGAWGNLGSLFDSGGGGVDLWDQYGGMSNTDLWASF